MSVDTLEHVAWSDFLSTWKFRQGEHVTILGPTGSGKTTLALQVLPRRRFVVVFGTKRKDSTLAILKKQGYKVERQWPPERAFTERVILWPKIEDDKDLYRQQQIFGAAMRDIYRSGGWCVYIDEIEYITSDLKLEQIAKLLWRQGRSNNVSVVSGNQRPAWVPLACYSEATHLFLFRNSDARNLKRLSELGAFDSDRVYFEVSNLAPHEVLYVDTRRGSLLKTKVERGG